MIYSHGQHDKKLRKSDKKCKACQAFISPRFFKNLAMGILQSPPSVTLSPPKPLDGIQPNLVCELLTCMGHATAQFFWQGPLGPWGGAKRSNIIQFQIFLNQTLCVFSQTKDIKHFRRDFHFVAWVMPQGWDLRGYRGGWGVKNYFFRNSTKVGV